MKKLILVIIVLLSSYFVFSQNNLYDIKQVKDSESKIVDFIENLELNNNYTFAVLLPLGSCPRCEGVIPLFYKQAKELFPDEDKMLLVIDDNHNAAIDFLSKHNYGTDKISIIPSNADILKTMCFTTDNIGVPYLMLINNKTGVIVNAVSSLGLTFDDDFFNDFVSDFDKKRIPICNEIINNKKNIVSVSLPFKTIVKEFDIECYNVTNVDSVVTSVYKYAVSDHSDKIAVIDYLTQNILLLDFNDGNYNVCSVIKPSEEEMRMFKDENVSEEMYQILKAMNIPNIFYLDIDFIENNEYLLYSASLPKIYWEDIVNEQLAYSNQACFIKRKVSDVKEVYYSTINTNSISDFSHSNFYFDDTYKYVYFPVVKGWPVKGTTSSPENEAEDPSKDSFYNDSYSVLKYGLDGNFIETISELPQWHKDNKTGYFFFKPIVKFDKNYTYITDSFTSTISILDNDSKISVKEINLAELLNINISDNNFVYEDSLNQLQLIQSKQVLLPINVIDMIPYNAELHFVILYNDTRYYLSLDKNNNIINAFVIPNEIQGYKIDNIKLYANNKVSLISLNCNNDKLEIVKLSL